MEANFTSIIYLPDQRHLHSLDDEFSAFPPPARMSEIDAVEDVRGF